MKTKPFLPLLAFCIMMAGCHNKNTRSEAGGATFSTADILHEVHFADTDSIEFLYYPQPQIQKEFKRFLIKDTVFINALARNLALPGAARTECSHHIKMYLFQKGEVYKTIYAATADSCHYLAYAVNGKPYFLPLTNNVKTALNNVVEQLKK